MRWLAPLLLLGVFLRHHTSQWLPGYSAAEWFYILGGVWEATLCASLLLLLREPLVRVALLIGILEAAQVSTCGAMLGSTRPPPGVDECDYLIGFPLGPWIVGLEIILIAVVTARQWKRL